MIVFEVNLNLENAKISGIMNWTGGVVRGLATVLDQEALFTHVLHSSQTGGLG